MPMESYIFPLILPLRPATCYCPISVRRVEKIIDVLISRE